jgi:hypothetical protein
MRRGGRAGFAVLAWLVAGACGDGATGDADAQPSPADAAAPDAAVPDAMPDATPIEPVQFENIRVEEIAAYRAVVRFTTSRETTCHIEFGTAVDAMNRTATDPDMLPGTFLLEHEVALEDLAPETTYFFAALVEDPDGHEFLSEVAQFSTGPGTPVDAMTNVALLSAGTGVVAVSSNFAMLANDSEWGANRAIDGIMATEWSSHLDGDAAFFELDLGQPRAVEVIGFRSREMSDGTSIVRSFELVVDGQQTLGPFETPDPDVRYIIELPSPVTMQTVRMNAVETSGGNTGLKELQLFVPAED